MTMPYAIEVVFMVERFFKIYQPNICGTQIKAKRYMWEYVWLKTDTVEHRN